MERVGLERRRGGSFYTARSVMSRLGILVFLVLVLLVSCILVRLPTDSFDVFGRGGGEVGGGGEGVEEVLIYGRFYNFSCIGRWWAKDDIMGRWVARRRGKGRVG